jgi:predicted DNA-binding transcriptional regulator YafY
MLAMAETHLQHLLPVSVLEQLRGYFGAAHQRLDAEPAPSHSRRWLDKVRSVPAAQMLLAPAVAPAVRDAVTDALLHERQLDIRYRRRGEEAVMEARVHPLALVQRGPVLYLSCLFFDYDDARMLPLHRVESAHERDEASRYPKDFSLDAQIERGEWAFGAGESIKLEAVFAPGYGDHLYETPLSKDQVIETLPNDRLRVTATVADTPQLVWWLLGFGGGVEVVAPRELREAICGEIKNANAVYQGPRSNADQ